MIIKTAILFNFDLESLIKASSTRQLFGSMSHQYKYTFVESIIRQRQHMLKEIDQTIKKSNENQPFKADVGASNNHVDESDSDVENTAI